MPKVLIANRGEIAIYTAQDTSHATFADEAVKLDDVSWFMSPERIIDIAKRTQSTHIHPGYGFLSESFALASLLASPTPGRPNVTFIGPAPETLRIAGDKMLSRNLAVAQGVPVARGTHVKSAADVRTFAEGGVRYPVMIKALDGGGGRGIRVASSGADVEEAFKRCMGESPSGQLFAEKALSGPGWKHVEVQIVGDGTGDVVHLWERECSVQRRFQKVVEMAPSTIPRNLVKPLLAASVKMARALRYQGVGTFEYLVNSHTGQWVFLEINPRIQVEHTVTEEITNQDLVRIQLLLSSSATLAALGLTADVIGPPQGCAIQLRLTAEDPAKDFRLSPGAIRPSAIAWPAGRGIRVDTWLCGQSVRECNVGTDFDSLLAKIVVRGRDLGEATQRAVRALRETSIGDENDAGVVKTNKAVLAGVVAHADWEGGKCDTMWLERELKDVTRIGTEALKPRVAGLGLQEQQDVEEVTLTSTSAPGSGSLPMQPGAIFHLVLSPPGSKAATDTKKHTLTLASIAHNTFPTHLSGTLQSTFSPAPLVFSLKQVQSSAGVSAGGFDLANPSDSAHVAAPLSGKIVELHPAVLAESGMVAKGDTIAVLSVMKMESVVVAPHAGRVVRRGKGVDVGVVVGEGMLLAVVDEELSKSRL
ncbi:carboxylase:pyruvate/acetyl-coa/propionyl-CoA [Athelia psychrophila]|uniref:Carboxylase:pyruvate/acetyl-coa/propionyl-CoA n=1 Tax=Athelia psychrophila TaxID=1759441 RepID=A0A166G4G3_9AGAM|nr:carboxylase:pyruvate/acetyl-coa/propionyl-CoA [Fibularhizoctonia sp. CBS 109695]